MRETLIAIALGAGDRIMERYQKPIDKEMKVADKDFKLAEDFVTIADKTADAYIREQLTIHFPDDQILSEENETLPTSWQ